MKNFFDPSVLILAITLVISSFGCASASRDEGVQPDRKPHCASQKKVEFYNISDTHVIVPTSKNSWRLSKDGLSILRDTIKRVNQKRPDFVFLSGDVMEGKFFGMKNLASAFDTLSTLKPRWFVVAGNHDGRYLRKDHTVDEFNKQKFFERFQGHGPSAEQGYWRHDFAENPITLIGLNTSVEGTSYGKIDEVQLKWLEATLADVPDNRIVMITGHHPLVLFNPTILEADKKELDHFVLQNHDEVRALLERYRHKVKFVLTGHTHSPEYKEVNGIHYIGTPSVNTWPNRFTRFELMGDTLRWEHLPISDQKKIDEAWKNLAADSPFKTVLKSDEALRNYFLHGPMSGEAKFDCTPE